MIATHVSITTPDRDRPPSGARLANEAIEFADRSMELISYYAIHASTELAKERGSYKTYEGSLWSQGILPKDSIKILVENRGSQYINVDDSETLDWDTVLIQPMLLVWMMGVITEKTSKR